MIRTRFAPSPTGSLHVGGVRTALYCLLYARKHGGKFVLRIEDTDQVRSTEEAAAGIQRDLSWCGLQWDEGPGVEGPYGPYFQSRRLDLYDRVVGALVESGHAYEAWDSREELDAQRRLHEAEKVTFKYRRRAVTPDQVAAWKAEGRVPVIRLAAPAHDVTVNDVILGPVTVTVADLEDIVIRKADGFPTYHFAVVIDDHEMHVTDILRGQEHLLNTHKHAGIAEALGWELPRCGHLPLIFNPQGAKMSKREKAQAARAAARAEQDRRRKEGGDPSDWSWLAERAGVDLGVLVPFVKKDNDSVAIAESVARALGVELPMIEVMDYRRGGYIPEALVNYLALLGWSPGDDREIMTLAEMIDAFSLDRVKHTAARFDPAKLKWMNGEYLRRLPLDRILAVIRDYGAVAATPLATLPEDRVAALLAMYRDRVDTLVELDRAAWFFFRRPDGYERKATAKHLDGAGIAKLRACREALASVPEWTAPALEARLTPIADGQLGSIAQPLRIALTGTVVSPSIFDTLAYFERGEALARIDALMRGHQ